jgi:cbb3-type cytochrome oxidase maturation protein
MIVIFILIPLSILIATGFLVAFIWAVRSGQYEDTCTPSLRMLWEDNGTKHRPACVPARPQPANQAPTKEEEK